MFQTERKSFAEHLLFYTLLDGEKIIIDSFTLPDSAVMLKNRLNHSKNIAVDLKDIVNSSMVEVSKKDVERIIECEKTR